MDQLIYALFCPAPPRTAGNKKLRPAYPCCPGHIFTISASKSAMALAIGLNIARIANSVHYHSYLSGNKDCHEFRFSIVRIVISVSNVISFWDCFCLCLCHCRCHCLFLATSCSLITLIKCLKGHKSLVISN